MSGLKIIVLAAALLLAGCVRLSPTPVQMAKEGQRYLCKHCNCFMPADADLNTICTACDCGYVGYQCIRGK